MLKIYIRMIKKRLLKIYEKNIFIHNCSRTAIPPPPGIGYPYTPPRKTGGGGYRFPGGGCMNFLMVDNEFPGMSIPPLRKTGGGGINFLV